jgi:succinyl-CoA synthetase beta subunit
MNLHEDQAKQLLREYKVPVSDLITIDQPEQAIKAWETLTSGKPVKAVMAKVLAHTGARGKAGGVKYIKNQDDLFEFAKTWLGKKIVTLQTGKAGLPVNRILITPPADIEQELYLSFLIDREEKNFVFVASVEGGMEIEKVAEEMPEKIKKNLVNALKPLIPGQDFSDEAEQIGNALGLSYKLQSELKQILKGIYDAFVNYDLSLVEINPLIIDKEGHLLCLDAKIEADDNALFRQPKLSEWRDPTQEDARENHAQEWGLNYIPLEGKIGCMVNGAGLAMATMDLIKAHGADPANFLDIGGTATKERVAEAFKLILSDENVKGVFVNIFGGIVRCDMVAEGIISAITEVGVEVPVMVRLVGNHADKGVELLRHSGLNLMASEDLTTAAKQIIEAID